MENSMIIDIDALIENAKKEGTTDKKRESFRNTISWDLLIHLLYEVKLQTQRNLLLQRHLKDAREAIESIEGHGMTCMNCEIYEDEWANGSCKVHQITGEWLQNNPRK